MPMSYGTRTEVGSHSLPQINLQLSCNNATFPLAYLHRIPPYDGKSPTVIDQKEHYRGLSADTVRQQRLAAGPPGLSAQTVALQAPSPLSLPAHGDQPYTADPRGHPTHRSDCRPVRSAPPAPGRRATPSRRRRARTGRLQRAPSLARRQRRAAGAGGPRLSSDTIPTRPRAM